MVAGATIASAYAPRGDVLRQVQPEDLDVRLRGQTITRVWRRAKLIILSLASGDALVVQPRFTGALLVEGSDTPISARDRAYVAITLTLADERLLHYRDIRRLGTVTLFSAQTLDQALAALGPEPLDAALTAERFSGSLRNSRQAIKKVLMDQGVLAGVGNIYANEACWLARIDPSRTADSLLPDEAATLLGSLRSILTLSIQHRGTSFRDYVDASGGRGGFVPYLEVYGRGGDACRRCGSRLIDTQAIDGRTTVFCWRCQS
jgi:formamidopyrimidine-DNA glycosylase